MLSRLKQHFKLVLLAVGLITLFISVSYWRNRNKPRLTKGQQTAQVKRRDIRSVLNLSGKVEAEEKAVLQFATSGRLTWLGVKEGDSVDEWQAIAALDQRELQKTLAKKLKDFAATREDFDQTKDDYHSQETSDKNTYLTDAISRIVRQEQYGLDKAVIDVELADLSLELATLYSPIKGIVTHMDQKITNVNITPATARFEIVNPESLYLEATIDQQDVVRLTNGMEATVIFDAFPLKEYTSSLYYTSFTPVSTDDGSYLVKFTLPSGILAQLRVGMAAEINLVTAAKKNVLSVPYGALIQKNGSNYVEVLINQQPTERKVQIGLEGDEYVEIVSGLKSGEIIVY